MVHLMLAKLNAGNDPVLLMKLVGAVVVAFFVLAGIGWIREKLER